MSDETTDDVGFAGDAKERDWIAEAQANCAVEITDADIGWASKAFLSIVMISAKFGRRAGEARLAHLAAERRAALADPYQGGATTPRAVKAPPRCGVNHCPGLIDEKEGPGFKMGKAAIELAGTTNLNHTLRVKVCRSCHHVHEAVPL